MASIPECAIHDYTLHVNIQVMKHFAFHYWFVVRWHNILVTPLMAYVDGMPLCFSLLGPFLWGPDLEGFGHSHQDGFFIQPRNFSLVGRE